MRVGFYMGNLQASDGGVYTLETTLFEALQQNSTQHDVLTFSARREKPSLGHSTKIVEIPQCIPSLLKRVNDLFRLRMSSSSDALLPIKAENQSHLAKLVREHRIELMWFFNGFDYVDVPYVMTVQDLQHRKQPIFPEVNTYGWNWNARENLYFSSIRRAAHLVSGSDEGKKDIERFYQIPPERISVIKLPTPNDVLKTPQPARQVDPAFDIKTPYIFYPAQFWSHKNHIALLLALKIIEDEFPGKLSLVLTGSDKGNLTYIKQKIKDLSLENSVKVLGVVERDQILALYQNALALVFPTLFGPDNIPPLEAFALECPVILGELPGCRRYFGDDAIYVDPTNESEIAKAILALTNNNFKDSEAARQAKQRAHEQTSESYLGQVFEIIDQLAHIRRCWGEMR